MGQKLQAGLQNKDTSCEFSKNYSRTAENDCFFFD